MNSRYDDIIVRYPRMWGTYSRSYGPRGQYLPLSEMQPEWTRPYFLDMHGPPRPCKTCGRPVLCASRRLTPYCSDECENAPPPRPKRTCEHCGEPFTATRSDARYCSTAHRVAAHRTRQ